MNKIKKLFLSTLTLSCFGLFNLDAMEPHAFQCPDTLEIILQNLDQQELRSCFHVNKAFNRAASLAYIKHATIREPIDNEMASRESFYYYLQGQIKNFITCMPILAKVYPELKISDIPELVINICLKNTQKNFLLHHAIANNKVELLTELIKHGANIEAKNIYGYTPLYYAAGMGKLECLTELLKHGANIEAKNNNGYTPLHCTAVIGNLECLTELLNHGANIEAKNNNGYTPLHCTAGMGNLECTTELLKHGANIEATNIHGKTPLDLAKEHNINADIIDLLELLITRDRVIHQKRDRQFDKDSDSGKKISRNSQ